MKKARQILSIAIIVCLTVAIIYATTETETIPSGVAPESSPVFISRTIDFDSDVNNATVTLANWQGYIDGLVIDSTGTDTSYKVYLLDEHGVTIFSKLDCSSASEPNRFAVSASDTGTTRFLGVPIDGTPQVQIADANNDAMTTMVVTVYGRVWRK